MNIVLLIFIKKQCYAVVKLETQLVNFTNIILCRASRASSKGLTFFILSIYTCLTGELHWFDNMYCTVFFPSCENFLFPIYTRILQRLQETSNIQPPIPQKCWTQTQFFSKQNAPKPTHHVPGSHEKWIKKVKNECMFPPQSSHSFIVMDIISSKDTFNHSSLANSKQNPNPF